jgi:CheY-like chemotaxis protein
MFRLLVVEDQADFYQDYLLRIFENMLPMETISVVHVPSLDAALAALSDPWDMILMDYSMGPKTEFMGDAVKDGADLISFRRAIEQTQGVPKAFILGTSSNQVGNRLMQERGADNTVLKLQVPQMAKMIEGALKNSE